MEIAAKYFLQKQIHNQFNEKKLFSYLETLVTYNVPQKPFSTAKRQRRHSKVIQ
jgi:hypothetical protein